MIGQKGHSSCLVRCPAIHIDTLNVVHMDGHTVSIF